MTHICASPCKNARMLHEHVPRRTCAATCLYTSSDGMCLGTGVTCTLHALFCLQVVASFLGKVFDDPLDVVASAGGKKPEGKKDK